MVKNKTKKILKFQNFFIKRIKLLLGILPKELRLVELSLKNFKTTKPIVFLVSHDANRTGAPILVYNITINLLKDFDVIILFLRMGPISDACRNAGAYVLGPIENKNANKFAQLLIKYIKPKYIFINSIASSYIGIALNRAGLKTVSLIHEFNSMVKPKNLGVELLKNSSATVFSSNRIKDDLFNGNNFLDKIDTYVIPQGQCVLPPPFLGPMSQMS